jgi:hypothetical protein
MSSHAGTLAVVTTDLFKAMLTFDLESPADYVETAFGIRIITKRDKSGTPTEIRHISIHRILEAVWQERADQ